MAARFSLLLAVLSVLVAAVFGVPLGALPVVLGPRAARVVNSIIDFAVALPSLLLAVFFTVVIGVGPASTWSPSTPATSPAFPANSPAVSANAWPSPAPSPCGPRC